MEKESDGFVEVEKNFENIKIWILKVHSRLPKIRVAFLLWLFFTRKKFLGSKIPWFHGTANLTFQTSTLPGKFMYR